MSDERSDQRDQAESEGPRESWLERFLHRFRPRDSIREDLEEVLSEATEGEEFSAHERAMLKNVLGFHRIRVSDVMVPRADISAVPVDTSLGELLTIFRKVGHSRLPAYGETLDEPLGMVHIRDFMEFITAKAEAGEAAAESETPRPDLTRVDLSITIAAANMIRPVLFVPQSMPAVDLLVRMQASHTHIALVIDEYGGTDGLVSIEDLIEMVVGDIEDEHDETAPMLVQEPGGTILADARASLEEVSEAFGNDLAEVTAVEDVDTIGGLVVTLAGRVPSRGEIITAPEGLEFEVLEADPRRLRRLRLSRRAETSAAEVEQALPELSRPAVPVAQAEAGQDHA